MSVKLYKKSISSFLNKEYKSYCNYVISNRGIPKVEDCLCHSERLILLNAPNTLEKTLSLSGKIFLTGQYHHGDASLNNTISKLAKEYQSSENLLQGKGQFGDIVNNRPASSRYTYVKINQFTKQKIDAYKHLNEKDIEGVIKYINADIPLGLLKLTLGIAVGFSTKILPREPNEILKYLENKKADLTPYFKGWKGKIVKDNNSKNRWIFEPEIKIEKRKITFLSIPPMLKFNSFLTSLNKVIDDLEFNVTCNNYSTEQVRVEIEAKQDFPIDVVERFVKCSKLAVTETITMVWNDKVIEYDKIEDYLDDFRIQQQFMYRDDLIYKIHELNFEILYLEWLLKYMSFMMESKRTYKEIEQFLKQVKNEKVVDRLDNFKLRKLHEKTVIETEKLLKEVKNDKDKKEKLLQKKNEDLKDKKIEFVSTRKSILENLILDDIKEFEIEEEDLEENEEIFEN